MEISRLTYGAKASPLAISECSDFIEVNWREVLSLSLASFTLFRLRNSTNTILIRTTPSYRIILSYLMIVYSANLRRRDAPSSGNSVGFRCHPASRRIFLEARRSTAPRHPPIPTVPLAIASPLLCPQAEALPDTEKSLIRILRASGLRLKHPSSWYDSLTAHPPRG